MSNVSGIRARLTGAVWPAVAALLIFVTIRGFPQGCPEAPPPKVPTASASTKPAAIPEPKERICCIFNWAKALDPKQLAGHVYGNGGDKKAATSETTEPVGYVYTGGAGLVDIAHVRDNADMVFWTYTQLTNGNHNFRVGNDTVALGTIPAGKDAVLALAGAIVFVNSWAHELVTWGDTPTAILEEAVGHTPEDLPPAEDFSAFSPEDMSSNIVGIQAATEAIDNGGDASPKAFSDQMDLALAGMMTNPKDPFWLAAQPVEETNKLLTQVEFTSDDKDLKGKWWMIDYSMPNMFIRLLRRNFDGTPWKLDGAPAIPTPAFMDTTRFSKLYGDFLYYMSGKQIVDATQVPNTTIHTLSPSTLLVWTPVPLGTIPEAARLGQALGGGSCLLDTHGKALGFGQYGTVMINVDPGGNINVIADMKVATTAIRNAFVKTNSCVPNIRCPLLGAEDAGPMDAP